MHGVMCEGGTKLMRSLGEAGPGAWQGCGCCCCIANGQQMQAAAAHLYVSLRVLMARGSSTGRPLTHTNCRSLSPLTPAPARDTSLQTMGAHAAAAGGLRHP